MAEGDLRRHFAAAAVVAEVQLDLGVARYKLVRRLRVGEFHKPSMGSGLGFYAKRVPFFRISSSVWSYFGNQTKSNDYGEALNHTISLS